MMSFGPLPLTTGKLDEKEASRGKNKGLVGSNVRLGSSVRLWLVVVEGIECDNARAGCEVVGKSTVSSSSRSMSRLLRIENPTG